MKITRKQTRQIWRKVMKGTSYDCRFVHYKRIPEIKGLGRVVSTILATLVTTRERFFQGRYITVVMPSVQTWIVTPYKIGKDGPPRHQVATLAHEFQHYIDFGGSYDRVGIYLLDGEHRANYEARGEAAGADLYRYMDMPVPKAKDVFDARWRDVYMCSTKHAELAKRWYNTLIADHKQDLFATEAGAIVAKAVKEVCG